MYFLRVFIVVILVTISSRAETGYSSDSFLKPGFTSFKKVEKAPAVPKTIRLAQEAQKWAGVANSAVFYRAKELMDLTRKAQKAQVQSLLLASIATRLRIAVTTAQTVYDEAKMELNVAQSMAKSALKHADALEMALQQLDILTSLRQRKSQMQQKRTEDLSAYLQLTLEELRQAISVAEGAHEDSLTAKSFNVFHYLY